MLLIIAGQSSVSPTAQWLPSHTYGCLWVKRVTDFMILPHFAPPDPLTRAANVIVAVEVAGDLEAIVQTVRRDPRGLVGLPPYVITDNVTYFYLGTDKLPPSATPVVPYVDNARDVDDAVHKIQALTKPSGLPPP